MDETNKVGADRCDCGNTWSYLDLVHQIKTDFKKRKKWKNPKDNFGQIIDITNRFVFFISGTNSITKKCMSLPNLKSYVAYKSYLLV